MGSLDWLRIVCPLEELTSDTGNGISGGGIIDLGDGATTIVEVRGDFGEMPTFASGILRVGGGDDVGDEASAFVGRKGMLSTGKCSVVQTSATLNWNSTGVASMKASMQTWLVSGLYLVRNRLTSSGSTPQGPIPRKNLRPSRERVSKTSGSRYLSCVAAVGTW